MSAVLKPSAGLRGLIHDMPADEYHAVDALGSSGLKRFLRSPAHYRFGDNGISDDAARVGTVTHTAILEPEQYASTVVVSPKFDRRTKAGKDAAEAFASEAAGKLVVDQDTHDLARRMADAVHAHPAARMLLSQGRSEVSGFWTDDESRVDCKMRADWLRDDGLIVDLKTARDASPGGFRRAIAQFGYAMQAALYLEGARALTGTEHVFVLVGVEKDPPHAVGVYALDPDSIAAATRQMRAALARLRTCIDTDTWPAYSDRIESISLPPWAITDSE